MDSKKKCKNCVKSERNTDKDKDANMKGIINISNYFYY